MLSQGFAFTLLHMTDIQRGHLYILFLPLFLNCGAQNQIWIHFKHNSVIWNINKYSTDRLLKLQAEPGMVWCLAIMLVSSLMYSALTRTNTPNRWVTSTWFGCRGHFYARLWNELRVHIASTPPDRYESGLMSNPNQYSFNSSLVPH